MPETSKTDKTNSLFRLANAGEGPKLTAAQLAFMKLTEQENLKRVKKLEGLRRRNWLTGWTLGFCVLSIYGYTILSIKQEKFLDDFNEPEKIIEVKK